MKKDRVDEGKIEENRVSGKLTINVRKDNDFDRSLGHFDNQHEEYS